MFTSRRRREREAWARVEADRHRRQVPLTAEAVEEVEAICTAALAERLGTVDRALFTRGGVVVAGHLIGRQPGAWMMRRALEAAGYVLGSDPGEASVIVTGWDPEHYTGPLATVAAVDERMGELLQLRAALLDRELAGPQQSPAAHTEREP
ncbi:hypothetical protein [Nonomuraea helvata]|uniref:Uncharacterized protein n=1 Tax=Nonomuraea helvata TaxID=37484 RepID=A0ABV5S632_9ACTN